MKVRFPHPLTVATIAFGLLASMPVAFSGAADTDPKAPSESGQVPLARIAVNDLDGGRLELGQLKGERGLVVVLLSTECPMSQAYTHTLGKLAAANASEGVPLVGLYTNPNDDAATVRAYIKQYNVSFPVYRDIDFTVTSSLGGRVNPEAFLLDGNLEVQYRGQIDDAFAARLKKKSIEATSKYLEQALGELVAGRPISVAQTKAIGCPIRLPRKGGVPLDDQVTFTRDVLPVLQGQCQSCHRPGQIAPFSLLTYEQAVGWGEDIKAFTQSREMPPWKPVSSDGRFHNQRKLSDEQIALLGRWVDAGMPEGDPDDAPPPVDFPDDWYLGPPDLVLTVSEEMVIGPDGPDLFRCFVLPVDLDEDKYVAAVEVRPGNPRVVHHTINYVDTQGRGRKLEAKAQAKSDPPEEDAFDVGPGYNTTMGPGFIPRWVVGGWAPGQVPTRFPEGVGFYLPKGSDVVVEMHYRRTGRVERDQTSIGLYFLEQPTGVALESTVVPGFLGVIPPGEGNFPIKGSMWIDRDIQLLSVMPHMHLLGKNIACTYTLPDGTTHELVRVDQWDYNWQETYYLKEPIEIPEGTRFDVVAHYDNTADNPLNPNSPPKPVRFGLQTADEMCFVFLGCTTDRPGPIQPRFRPPEKKVTAAIPSSKATEN